MSIQLTVEVADVNTILEGLGRINENSARVADIVRGQASAQFNAQLEAERAAQQAPQPTAVQVPVPSADETATPQA